MMCVAYINATLCVCVCVCVQEVLAEGSRLEVLYDFEAQDQAELSVSAGQYISLICPHDRIGCVEWWLVRTTSSQGYVPATYLAECTCSSSS